jgi:hypothetical protein
VKPVLACTAPNASGSATALTAPKATVPRNARRVGWRSDGERDRSFEVFDMAGS